MTDIKISRGFRCAYCARQRHGAYRIVDGRRSCERCNRAYDYKPTKLAVICPICKGCGVLTDTIALEKP